MLAIAVLVLLLLLPLRPLLLLPLVWHSTTSFELLPPIQAGPHASDRAWSGSPRSETVKRVFCDSPVRVIELALVVLRRKGAG